MWGKVTAPLQMKSIGRDRCTLLTFLDIGSLLGLGGRRLCDDLGQNGEEAEEQVGAPESHTAAAGCSAEVRKQRLLQPELRVLKAVITGTSV